MKKLTASFLIISSSIYFLTACTKKEEEAPVPVVVKLTYDKDIKAILTTSCTPCHLATGTNPNKWDDFTQAKAKISSIINRIEREPGTAGFMPRNGTAKLPLETVNKLKQWLTDGLLEK